MLVEKIADLKAALAAAQAVAAAQAAAAKEAEPEPEPEPEPVSSPDKSRAPLIISWTVTGVAVASGVTFGLMAQSQRGQINSELCDDLGGSMLCQAEARSYLEKSASNALAADISWGLAAVGLGTSLWLTLRGKPLSKGPEVFVGPQSLGLRGTF